MSFPSRHPYVSKFDYGEIRFVNPGTDYFSEGNYLKQYISIHHPPESYDVVHIHFSFDKVPLNYFENLLAYFKKIEKPIVWTCHSRESQRIKNLGRGRYQQLLFEYSDRIISPTKGCAEWIGQKFGKHKGPIEIIPLGFLADPDEVKKLKRKTKKHHDLFTYLVGEFRENKEIVQSIINFLHCKGLNKVRLQLIFKPLSFYKKIYGDYQVRGEVLDFFSLIDNPRIKILSKPEISNQEIIRAFLESHAIILPYKWGTHSGQIELAKDCGCHVVTTNVGYFVEQWDKIICWDVSDNKVDRFSARYAHALKKAYHRKPLEPMGEARTTEFLKIYDSHLNVYKSLISKSS